MSYSEMKVLLALSIVINLMLVFALFINVSGVSFGDRCAVHYGTSTRGWQKCVDDLSNGRPMRIPRQEQR